MKTTDSENELIIEIFDRDKLEIFRTFNALEDSPYTLFDISVYSRDELFQANVFAQKRFDSLFDRALGGERIWLGEGDLWQHEVHPIRLQEEPAVISWYTAFLPLSDRYGNVTGVMTFRSRTKPKPSGPSTPDPLRTSELMDFLKTVGYGLAASALYDLLKWTLLSEDRSIGLKKQEVLEVIHLYEENGVQSLIAA